MVRFKGVATKYLNNYLEWHRFLDATSKVGEVVASKQLVTEACSALRPAPKPLAQPLSA